MKNLNKKGFILVETLIVTVFVVTLFIIIYQASVPAMGEYEQLNRYDDIDSIYYSNLYKQMLTRYANMDYIDTYLQSHTYVDASDCTNTDIYKDSNYCTLLHNALHMSDKDKVFVTDYNIASFKKEVKSDDMFDSGTLSNFRDYLRTVSNTEKFYNNKDSIYVGKYRLFMVRNIKDADGTTNRRYSNIGIYNGSYENFLQGEVVYFDPNGLGEQKFYVLKNSYTTDSNLTLILANNIENSNVCFNSTKLSTSPDTALAKLRELTDSWTKVSYLSNYKYISRAGYEIDYSNYRSRLIDDYDILEILGCKEDQEVCFDSYEAFAVNFDDPNLSFLIDNLDDTTGYWTSSVVPNSDLYAWSIKKGVVAPTILEDEDHCTDVGIRPIIVVPKEAVRRG